MKPVIPSRFETGDLEDRAGQGGSVGAVQINGIDVIIVLLAVDLQLVINQRQTAVEALGAPDDQPVRVSRVGGFKVLVACSTHERTRFVTHGLGSRGFQRRKNTRTRAAGPNCLPTMPSVVGGGVHSMRID